MAERLTPAADHAAPVEPIPLSQQTLSHRKARNVRHAKRIGPCPCSMQAPERPSTNGQGSAPDISLSQVILEDRRRQGLAASKKLASSTPDNRPAAGLSDTAGLSADGLSPFLPSGTLLGVITPHTGHAAPPEREVLGLQPSQQLAVPGLQEPAGSPESDASAEAMPDEELSQIALFHRAQQRQQIQRSRLCTDAPANGNIHHGIQGSKSGAAQHHAQGQTEAAAAAGPLKLPTGINPAESTMRLGVHANAGQPGVNGLQLSGIPAGYQQARESCHDMGNGYGTPAQPGTGVHNVAGDILELSQIPLGPRLRQCGPHRHIAGASSSDPANDPGDVPLSQVPLGPRMRSAKKGKASKLAKPGSAGCAPRPSLCDHPSPEALAGRLAGDHASCMEPSLKTPAAAAYDHSAAEHAASPTTGVRDEPDPPLATQPRPSMQHGMGRSVRLDSLSPSAPPSMRSEGLDSKHCSQGNLAGGSAGILKPVSSHAPCADDADEQTEQGSGMSPETARADMQTPFQAGSEAIRAPVMRFLTRLQPLAPSSGGDAPHEHANPHGPGLRSSRLMLEDPAEGTRPAEGIQGSPGKDENDNDHGLEMIGCQDLVSGHNLELLPGHPASSPLRSNGSPSRALVSAEPALPPPSAVHEPGAEVSRSATDAATPGPPSEPSAAQPAPMPAAADEHGGPAGTACARQLNPHQEVALQQQQQISEGRHPLEAAPSQQSVEHGPYGPGEENILAEIGSTMCPGHDAEQGSDRGGPGTIKGKCTVAQLDTDTSGKAVSPLNITSVGCPNVLDRGKNLAQTERPGAVGDSGPVSALEANRPQPTGPVGSSLRAHQPTVMPAAKPAVWRKATVEDVECSQQCSQPLVAPAEIAKVGFFSHARQKLLAWQIQFSSHPTIYQK